MFGFIGKTGNRVIEPQFDEPCPFVDGRAAVMIKESTDFLAVN